MLNAPIRIVMSVTEDMWCYEPLKSALLTNHRVIDITIIMWFDPVLYVMVVPMLAAHALMGISIRNPLFSSDRLCMTTIYNLTWTTSVFVRECGLNLADAIMQRSMSHFGRCRYCYSGALLSGSGHCCPFRVRAPVDFLHGRPIIGLRGFVLCPKISMWMPGNIIFSNTACGSLTTT